MSRQCNYILPFVVVNFEKKILLCRMPRQRGGGNASRGRGRGNVPYRGSLLTRNETHASNRAYDDVS